MNIAFPLWKIPARNHGTGISWYIYNLIRSLAKIDKENSYTLFNFKSSGYNLAVDNLKEYLPEQENFRTLVRRINSTFAKNSIKRFLPAEILIGRQDIIHMLSNPEPVTTASARFIITIHDLIPLLPETKILYRFRKEKFRKNLTSGLLKADRIIAISRHTKDDIVRHYRISPEKISVVHLGVDNIFRLHEPSASRQRILLKYKLVGKYLMYAGDNNPRKNLRRIADAFQRVARDFPEYRLVIVGPELKSYESFVSIFSRLSTDVRDRILIAGYVLREDLPSLYSGASALLFPSLYEGFGLPILEAMACGCPVITSNVSSMPEVAGCAAVLVDPYNTRDISDSIEKVLVDADLRMRLREKGLERAKSFSWEKTASQTLKVYAEACGTDVSPSGNIRDGRHY